MKKSPRKSAYSVEQVSPPEMPSSALVHTRHVSAFEHSILLAACFVMLFTSFFFISSQLKAQTRDTDFSVTAIVPEQPKKLLPIISLSLLGTITLGVAIIYLFVLKKQKKNTSTP